MEPTVLIGAIAFLFGVVTAVAKVAWSERAERLKGVEEERNRYRDEVMEVMKHVLAAQESHDTGLKELTRVVEAVVKELPHG